MTKRFRVICTETVRTELVVEAPDQSTLQAWLDGDPAAAADAVSENTGRQEVHERDYSVLCDVSPEEDVDLALGETRKAG